VFGMNADYGGKPWSWVHHMAVVTAAAVNDPKRILFWHEHEPTGHWWEQSRPFLTMKKITAPREIHGRELVHPAHRADVVRLEALIDHGGVYIDADVWCLKPFASIEHRGFWMGRQGPSYGLCNATMGGTKGSPFAKRWLAEYATFRSRGRDQYWDEHSVRLPLKLARKHRDEITIFPQSYFFSPLWRDLGRIFRPGAAARGYPRLVESYSVHLWESIAWDFLKRLGPDRVPCDSEIGARLAEIGVL